MAHNYRLWRRIETRTRSIHAGTNQRLVQTSGAAVIHRLLLNGLAPWRSLMASTTPHSLDVVLLPAYILRCLFFLSVLPALAVLPAYAACAACAACGLALFFYSVICVRT
jgi:hypothetical protein